MNTSLSAELRCRAELGLEEMDESHWMKFTNTRHLSPLVMYTYPILSVVILFFFFFYNLHFNWSVSATVLFFCLLLSLPLWLVTLTVPYSPLSLIYFFSLSPSFTYACHIKYLIKVFIFLCNKICTLGSEAYYPLHFPQNNILWPK